MHYDPYESSNSKKRRLISNICAVFILLAMTAAIIYLFIPKNNQKKYEFDKLETSVLTADDINGGECEFNLLHEELNCGSQIDFDESFEHKFPQIYSLLSLDQTVYSGSSVQYSEGKTEICELPYVSVGGGYIALAQTVVSSETGCRDMMVIVYKAEATDAGNVFRLSLNDHYCYTVRYNTRDAKAPLKLLSGKQSASLDLFKLTVTASGAQPVSAGYDLTLSHAFEPDRAKEKLYHQIIFDPINNSYCSPQITKLEKTTVISVNQNVDNLKNNDNSVSYAIDLKEDYVNLFDSVNFKFEFSESNIGIKLTFN